jgi:hypothetical protein
MENLLSLTGINMKNGRATRSTSGTKNIFRWWRLQSTIPPTLSPAQNEMEFL